METIKYIDRANYTIKNLMEKTSYRKIRELLLVLNSGINQQFRHVLILKNRFEEMNNLKIKFIETLLRMAKKKIN